MRHLRPTRFVGVRAVLIAAAATALWLLIAAGPVLLVWKGIL